VYCTACGTGASINFNEYAAILDTVPKLGQANMTGHDDTRSIDKYKPSRIVEKFAERIVNAAKGFPVLDVACGSGRNADVFLRRGCKVICLDRDLSQLESRYSRESIPCELKLLKTDLISDPWPVGTASVGAIINIHFLLPSLFSPFAESLIPGGYLLIETVPGCGGNYIQLPKVNKLRSDLSQMFKFDFYKENRVGPPSCEAVTVRLAATRKTAGDTKTIA
jgi:SAM-dependent methyltransferase